MIITIIHTVQLVNKKANDITYALIINGGCEPSPRKRGFRGIDLTVSYDGPNMAASCHFS